MRKLIFVIPLLLFQSIWICCSDGNKRRPEQMNTIELEMQRDPQAALNILNNINHEMPNYSEQVRMEYELMLIQALDKTLHPLTDYKSKIDSVVNYFKKKGTDLQRARAYYYMGGFFRDKQEKFDAINWYQKALGEINKTALSSESEKSLASVICAQLSGLLYRTSNYSEALKYALLEYDYTTSSIGKFEAACDLAIAYEGIAYIDRCSQDSIIKYYDIAFSVSQKITPKGTYYPLIMLSQASFFLDMGMKDKAKERLKLIDLNSFRNDTSQFYTLGIVYDGLGKTDSALYFYHKTTEMHNAAQARGAYYRLMKHEYDKGNWKAAADYGMKFKVANDSAIKQADAARVSANLTNQESKNLAFENEVLKEKLKSREYSIALCVSIFCILLSIIIIAAIVRQRKFKKLLKSESTNREKILNKLETQRKKLDAITVALENEKATVENLKSELCRYKNKKMLELPKVKDFREELCELVKRESAIPMEQIHELSHIISTEMPEAKEKMEEFLSRNLMYASVFGLKLLGFRNKEISILTGNSTSNVSNYLSKIYYEVTGNKYNQNTDYIMEIRAALTKESENKSE